MEKLKCPQCIDEELVRSIGNLLVCPNCDVVFVEARNSSNWFDKPVEVLKSGTINP